MWQENNYLFKLKYSLWLILALPQNGRIVFDGKCVKLIFEYNNTTGLCLRFSSKSFIHYVPKTLYLMSLIDEGHMYDYHRPYILVLMIYVSNTQWTPTVRTEIILINKNKFSYKLFVCRRVENMSIYSGWMWLLQYPLNEFANPYTKITVTYLLSQNARYEG